MRKPFPFYPYLLALAPVLQLYAVNLAEVPAVEVLVPAAVVLAATALLCGLLFFVRFDAQAAALAAAPVVLVALNYDAIRVRVHVALAAHTILLPILGVALVAFAWGVLRRRRDLAAATSAMNVASVVLVALACFTMARVQLAVRSGVRAAEARAVGSDAASTGGLPYKPDVYYIILDAYTGENVLKTMYQYDNSGFYAELHRRGFFVADRARCNYPMTFLSLACSLNMRYLDEMLAKTGADDRKDTYELVRDSEVSRFFQDRGYAFVTFSSGWGATDKNPYADVFYQRGQLNEFSTAFLANTALMPFLSKAVGQDRRERTLSTFSELALLPRKIPGPKFVLAHFVLPHPPYLFGPGGEKVDQESLALDGPGWKEYRGYLGQLQFANKMALETVDAILAASKNPPIIILQGDHGSLTFSSFNDPNDAVLKERFSILLAVLSPDPAAHGKLESDMTPVNLFRALLSAYFGGNREPLPARHYFSNYLQPYPLRDVTKRVQEVYDDASIVGMRRGDASPDAAGATVDE
jgi:hypothetical protein